MTKEQKTIKAQATQINDLTANARLTLFLAQTNGIKVEQPKEGD